MQRKYTDALKLQLHFPKGQLTRKSQQPKNIQIHSPVQIPYFHCHPTRNNNAPCSQFLTISDIQNKPTTMLHISNVSDSRHSLPNCNIRQESNQTIPSPLLNPRTQIPNNFKSNDIISNDLMETAINLHQPTSNTMNIQSPQIITSPPQDYSAQKQQKVYKIPKHVIRNLQQQQTSPMKVEISEPKTNGQWQKLSVNPVRIHNHVPVTQSPTLPSYRQSGRIYQSLIFQDKNPDIKYTNGHNTAMKLGTFQNLNGITNNHFSRNKPVTATKSFGKVSNASNDSNPSSNLINSSVYDARSLVSADGVTNININGKSYAQTQGSDSKKPQINQSFFYPVGNFVNIQNHKKQEVRKSLQYSINKNQSAGNLAKMSHIKLSEPLKQKNDDFLKDVRKSIQNLKVDVKPNHSSQTSTQGFPGPVPPIDWKFRKKNDGATTPQKDHINHTPGFIHKKAKEVVTNSRIFTADDFEIIQKLGKGTYGDVFLARQRKTRFVCVLKALSKKRIKQLGIENHVFRQIKIQSYLFHKHITNLYGVFDDENKIYLIMQCVPDGSMHSNGKKKISESQAAHLIVQTCEGLLYIHRQNIIHRDIKPQNLLLNYTYLKIADFGCAVFGKTLRNTVVGSYVYISPQQFSNNPYDEKIDSWSVGILAYQMLIGKPPYQQKLRKIAMTQGMPSTSTQQSSSTNSSQIKDVKTPLEQTMDFPQVQFPQNVSISMQAIQFIHRLLDKDPVRRADIKEALKHKFLIKAKQYQKYLQSQLQSKL